jgi:hypothetical protein
MDKSDCMATKICHYGLDGKCRPSITQCPVGAWIPSYGGYKIQDHIPGPKNPIPSPSGIVVKQPGMKTVCKNVYSQGNFYLPDDFDKKYSWHALDKDQSALTNCRSRCEGGCYTNKMKINKCAVIPTEDMCKANECCGWYKNLNTGKMACFLNLTNKDCLPNQELGAFYEVDEKIHGGIGKCLSKGDIDNMLHLGSCVGIKGGMIDESGVPVLHYTCDPPDPQWWIEKCPGGDDEGWVDINRFNYYNELGNNIVYNLDKRNWGNCTYEDGTGITVGLMKDPNAACDKTTGLCPMNTS